jgi:NhaP-type Na+/H+ or K+/H+ antiporter
MAGFAAYSIYCFVKSSDKWDRISYAFWIVAFVLFAYDNSIPSIPEGTPWITYIGIVLAAVAIIIRRRNDARRNRH